MWKQILFRPSFHKLPFKKHLTKKPFRTTPLVFPKNFTKCFVLANALNFLSGFIQSDEPPFLDFTGEQLTEEMKNACHKSVEALVELMRTLNVCMMEINKEYASNMEKQIQITKNCTGIGPFGDHWDELTKYRVQADELKMEFNKYELLVQKVGQMVFYQAVASLMSGNEKEMDLLNYEYNRLEKLVEDLVCRNKDVETKLLTENRDSILQTAAAVFEKKS